MENNRALLTQWAEQLHNAKRVRAFREPIINGARLVDILVAALEQSQPVTFIGISCQQWVKDMNTDPERYRTVGGIIPQHSRPRKFINEIAKFFESISSFGIEYVFHYSISDAEVRKLYLVDDYYDGKGAYLRSRHNQGLLGRELEKAGVKVAPFSVTEVLMTALNLETEEDLGKTMREWGEEFTQTINRLSFTHLLPQLLGAERERVIWLDVQNMAHEAIVKDWQEKAQTHMPEMPIISTFRNCGYWESKGSAINTYPTKQELLAKQST